MNRLVGVTNGLAVGAFFVLLLVSALGQVPVTVEWVN